MSTSSSKNPVVLTDLYNSESLRCAGHGSVELWSGKTQRGFGLLPSEIVDAAVTGTTQTEKLWLH
jgi:hypothetical protein